MDTITYVDLYHVLPDTPFNFSAGEYYDHESNVLTPALTALGYTVGNWYTGERDSFGPLSRCVPLTKDEITVVAVYG